MFCVANDLLISNDSSNSNESFLESLLLVRHGETTDLEKGLLFKRFTRDEHYDAFCCRPLRQFTHCRVVKKQNPNTRNSHLSGFYSASLAA